MSPSGVLRYSFCRSCLKRLAVFPRHHHVDGLSGDPLLLSLSEMSFQKRRFSAPLFASPRLYATFLAKMTEYSYFSSLRYDPLPPRDEVLRLLEEGARSSPRASTAQALLVPYLDEIRELINDRDLALTPKTAFSVVCQRHDHSGKVNYTSFKRFVRTHTSTSNCWSKYRRDFFTLPCSMVCSSSVM